MAKNKKKAGKQSKKKQAAKPRQPPPSRAIIPLSFVKQACGITNPFCDEATLARWPDNSYTKSVTWNIHGRPGSYSTDANGYAGELFLPALRPFVPAIAPIVAPAMTFSNMYYAGGMSAPSGVARYRITSWGVRFRAIGTPMTIKGTLRVRLFSPMSGVSLTTTDMSTVLADASYDIPLARMIDKDLYVIPAPLGISARTFRDYDADNAVTTLANFDNPGWQVIQMAIDGGPASTAVLEAAVYYHYEFVYKDGEASSAFATAPPPNNPKLQDVNAGLFERIGNFLNAGFDAVERLYSSKAGQLALAVGASYVSKSPAPLAHAMIKDVD